MTKTAHTYMAIEGSASPGNEGRGHVFSAGQFRDNDITFWILGIKSHQQSRPSKVKTSLMQITSRPPYTVPCDQPFSYCSGRRKK